MIFQRRFPGDIPMPSRLDVPLRRLDGTLASRWRMAYRRLDEARGTPFEVTCRKVLAHLEAGWALVEPLPHHDLSAPLGKYVEPSYGNLRSLPPQSLAASLESFCHLNVVDPFRDLMDACANYVRGAYDPHMPDLFDLLCDTESMVHAYHVLLLAASDPQIPEETRGRIRHADGLGEWYDTFREIYEPFAALIESLRLSGQA